MRKLTIWSMSLMFLLGLMGMGLADAAPPNKDLTNINPSFMVTPQEVYDWHFVKDQAGPTHAGNPAWKNFLEFLESELLKCGVVDVTRNKWTYDRWYTSEWPDDSNWTLISDGGPVQVAHYSAFSGSTTEAGITAELIYYDPTSPPPLSSLAGKIVVFKTAPHPTPPLSTSYKNSYTVNDHEYIVDPETFSPQFTVIPLSVTVWADDWYQLGQTGGFVNIVKNGGAAGGIIVFDKSYERTKGIYKFGVPALYSAPTLFLDKVAGSKVIDDAKNGKMATIKLLATVENTETYQLIGYLPGKDYGTEKDEQILLVTHTDGPSVTQENGAFGVLAIVKYFSHIPQSERPRTLTIKLDNRHYMPGAESGFAKEDWYAIHPDLIKKIVGVVATEHLGVLEYKEVEGVYMPVEGVGSSYLWSRNNQLLIDMAIEAVEDNDWRRVRVLCIERPGVNGGMQGPWYGLGSVARTWGIPGYGTMGSGLWRTTDHMERFDEYHFYTQVASMSQLTGELMLAKLIAIDPLWGILRTSITSLADTAFVNPNMAATQKNTLLNKIDAVFNQVKAGAYRGAIEKLRNDVQKLIKKCIAAESQPALLTQIENAIAKLQATP